MKQMTPSADHADKDMLDAFHLAESMIRECIEELPYSNLETAIILLRQERDQLQETDPLRSNALHHLSLAMHAKFNQYGWVEDFNEIFKLSADIWADIKKGTFKPHVCP